MTIFDERVASYAKWLSRLWRRDPIPLLALFFSVLAFSVSVRSCYLSEETLVQSRVQFKQERSLVLTAKFEPLSFEPSRSGITVTPLDSAFRFLEGFAYLPPSIYKSEIPITSTGEFLHMGSVQRALTRVVEEKIPKEKDYAKMGSGHLPLFIKSYYVTKGEAYTDISLYFLKMDTVVVGDPAKAPTITFTGLSFVQRLPAHSPFDLKVLDDIVTKPDGVYIHPKSP